MINPDGTGRTRITTDASVDSAPTWSPDGRQIAFQSNRSGQWKIYVMDADGSNVYPVTSGTKPAWSPDGTRLVFPWGDRLRTINIDGTNEATHLLPAEWGYVAEVFHPRWSPDGTEFAFVSLFCGEGGTHCIYPDLTFLEAEGTSGRITYVESGGHDWSPNAQKLAYYDSTFERLAVVNRDGTGASFLPPLGDPPAWSPDGTKIAYVGWPHPSSRISIMNADGSNGAPIGAPGRPITPFSGIDWQPIPINAYPRPKGATPFLTYLVPAYAECTSPNREHGPSLSFGSCNPPTQSSNALTIGSADSNGKPTKSVSSVRFDTLVGNPSTPADEADVKITAQVIDVYTQAGLDDYAGELTATTPLRITDKLNTPHPGGPGAGTVSDIPYSFTIPCAETADTTIGGSCLLSTSADALAPGAVKEGKRSIWALGQVGVYDADNAPFMKQGIFVP